MKFLNLSDWFIHIKATQKNLLILWLHSVFVVFKADTEEQNKAVALCDVGGSIIGIPALISPTSAASVLIIFDLMTKRLEHLTFEWRLTHEERAGIV